MISNKKHLQQISTIRDLYDSTCKELEYKYRAEVNEEYNRAVRELRGQLRTWLVDLNYEIFNSSQNLIRPRLYAAMASALAQFHEKTPIVQKKDKND